MKKLLDKYKSMNDGDVAAMWAFGSMLLNVIMACYNVFIWSFSKTYLFLVMCFYYMLLAIMRFFAGFTVHLFFKKKFNDFTKIILQACGGMMFALGVILLVVVASREGKPTVTLDNWMAWGYGVLALSKILMSINGARNARKYQDVMYSLVQRIGLVEATLTVYTFFQSVIYVFSVADTALIINISLVIGVIASALVMINGYQTMRYDPRYYEAVSGIMFHKKGKQIKENPKKQPKVAKEGMVFNPWQDEKIIIDRNAKVDWTAGIADQLKESEE